MSSQEHGTPRSNRRLVARLAIMAACMFGFGFLLIPIYNVMFEITGIGGRTSDTAAVIPAGMQVDTGRTVTVEFVAVVNEQAPWEFRPAVSSIEIHPGQLYEAIAYLVIFLLILFIYKKKGPKSVGSGLYFGLCLTLIFTFRFFVEYTKEIQVAFEAGLPMDMGQILSLPLIIAGIWSIAYSPKRAAKKENKA